MQYTIEDYKYDFIYYLSYLKNNSSNLYNINIKELYENNKEKIIYSKDINEFFDNLKNFCLNNLPYYKFGHNHPIDTFYMNKYKKYIDIIKKNVIKIYLIK